MWAESQACFGVAELCCECLKQGLRLQTWRDRVMELPASPLKGVLPQEGVGACPPLGPGPLPLMWAPSQWLPGTPRGRRPRPGT